MVRPKADDVCFLECRGVAKGFGGASQRTEALEDIHLSVREGEFVAIVGASGAGKTTLISLLAGLLSPDRGAVAMAGQPITGPSRARGVVFQHYSLLPWLGVAENIALAVDAAFPHWPSYRRLSAEHAS
jgi:nitrate/nitrite transport system ATP-binding protein